VGGGGGRADTVVEIAPGHKFACFVLGGCGVRDDLPDEVILAPNISAVRKLGVALAEHWKLWLGSLTVEELQEAGLVLLATMPSSQPKILDQENYDLVRALDYLLFGILLQGVPRYENGFSINGGNADGDGDVRQFGTLDHNYPSFGMKPFRPSEADLRRALTLAGRLRQANTGGVNWQRLRRGIRALLEGTKVAQDEGERVHQFVRALESLVKPEAGKTRNQFAHRIDQTFTLAGAPTREALLQAFDMRSHAEHLHSVLDVLDGPEAQQVATAQLRTRQMDVAARFALARVLESDTLFETFKSDNGIDAFWALDDAQRVTQWGSRLDLGTVQ
jgi:hypothetical protein